MTYECDHISCSLEGGGSGENRSLTAVGDEKCNSSLFFEVKFVGDSHFLSDDIPLYFLSEDIPLEILISA